MMTIESAALLSHLEELNAKTMAWIDEAPTQRWATTWVADLQHWAEYGVHTVEDFTKYCLATDVYEATREIYGYKPSWAGLMGCSIEELEADVKTLREAAAYQAEQQRIYEAEMKSEEEYMIQVRTHESWLYAVHADHYADLAEAAGW
jgi:hypothetical protein